VNKDALRLGAIALVLVAALAVGAALYLRAEEEEDSARAEKQAARDPDVFVREHSPTLGPDEAEVQLVEFFDPECEACRAMHPYVKRVLDEYGDRVQLVLRYMPLHRNSVYAAGALEAAGAQGRYWEMLDALFRHQPVWGDHHAPKPELIPEYAEQIGLDMTAFERFMERGAYRTLVDIDRRDAIALGVRGTPTFFVNGEPLARLGYEPLRDRIRAELAP